eukprot:TRINITY_DN5979_c1_g2_i1.p1 TRINITY_DN5979_c1_g2~~TRINITY_DN5979_c1_g2_i1.p1  ORF type:complete len:327 (-),score=47.33 TRINITY_DN5979_c1_g2_i1:572-1405(-)
MGDKAAAAGGVAGAVEAIVVQPLDMIKTRFQLNSGANPSMYSAMRQILAKDGVLGLYRGLLPEMAGNIPTRTAMFAGKSLASDVLVRLNGRRSALTEMGAGAFAGVPEAVATTPFQVVKVRMQNVQNNSAYRNSLHCCFTIVKQEGVLALFSGLGTTMCRNAVWNGVYFGSMVVITENVPQVDMATAGVLGQMQRLGTGFAGGVTATCCNAPLDVCKSRIQSSPDLKGASTFRVLLRIAREEGPRALYKGFVPKAWRMGCGGAVGITTFELIMGMIS